MPAEWERFLSEKEIVAKQTNLVLRVREDSIGNEVYRWIRGLHSFFYKNNVFPEEAEYSYFSADSRLKIIL